MSDIVDLMAKARIGELLRDALYDELAEKVGIGLPPAAMTAIARGLRDRIEAAGYAIVRQGDAT